MKLSAIASGGRGTGKRKPRQAVSHYLRRSERKVEALSSKAPGASAAMTSWHDCAMEVAAPNERIQASAERTTLSAARVQSG